MDAFIFFIFPLKKPITQHWILTVDQQCCFQDILSGFSFFFLSRQRNLSRIRIRIRMSLFVSKEEICIWQPQRQCVGRTRYYKFWRLISLKCLMHLTSQTVRHSWRMCCYLYTLWERALVSNPVCFMCGFDFRSDIGLTSDQPLWAENKSEAEKLTDTTVRWDWLIFESTSVSLTTTIQQLCQVKFEHK